MRPQRIELLGLLSLYMGNRTYKTSNGTHRQSGADQWPLSLTWINFNPLRAKFFRGNINLYLHFVSFLHVCTTQVVEILPQIRQETTYST